MLRMINVEALLKDKNCQNNLLFMPVFKVYERETGFKVFLPHGQFISW